MARAIDKYVCPFCGQKTLFVGVHDDEGNYKGRPGCDYESNPWSGLCYAIHHGWGIVKVNREGIFVVTKSGEYEFGRCKVYRRPPEGESDA